MTGRRSPAKFTALQKRELQAMKVGPLQIAALEEVLPVLADFTYPAPAAPEVRDEVRRFHARAKKDIAELKALITARGAAKKKAATMLAFYLHQPMGYVRMEPPVHADPPAVLQRALDHARHLLWATEMVMDEVKGTRPTQASWVPVAMIVAALKRGTAQGERDISVSYGEGHDFRRIVSICMGAAGGNSEQGYERSIRAYRATMKRNEGDSEDADDPC